MFKEAAMITISCVLFVQMGLSRAIQERIGFNSKILSCSRCLTFWSVLMYMLLTGHGVLPSVTASFLSALSALWLSLLYDALAKFYNTCYDAISETTDTASEAEANPGQDQAGDSNEVSEV